MKKLTVVMVACGFFTMQSCTVGKGCPSNGKNIGAERLLSGDPKAVKAAKHAGKFKD